MDSLARLRSRVVDLETDVIQDKGNMAQITLETVRRELFPKLSRKQFLMMPLDTLAAEMEKLRLHYEPLPEMYEHLGNIGHMVLGSPEVYDQKVFKE